MPPVDQPEDGTDELSWGATEATANKRWLLMLWRIAEQNGVIPVMRGMLGAIRD